MSYIRPLLRKSGVLYDTSKKSTLFSKRFISTNLQYINNNKVKSSSEDIIDLDAPIKFSSSKALKWKAKTSRMGNSGRRLWYEPYVILGSIAVFLIYFTCLREENDVDKELQRTLYSRIDGLEELQLKASLKYNVDNGLDTKDITDRLKEIRQEKEQ